MAEDGLFNPGYDLPSIDPEMERYFSVSAIEAIELEPYRGRRIRLLDLRLNPRTRTAKTFASLLIVARAVNYIRRTGESIVLVTPTSGNKGSALRDAVTRALECGLVEPEQLRIAVVVPSSGMKKLWHSPLSESPSLAELNPVFVAKTESGTSVKSITSSFVEAHTAMAWKNFRTRIWHTYSLDNYRMADSVRAFFESENLGPSDDIASRIHAQSVSSAFGLLGYDLGRRVVNDSFGSTPGSPPRWLLVQHLGTPDLVAHQQFKSFSRSNIPSYTIDESTGLFIQSSNPNFPQRTYAVNENLDSTFYTHCPKTASIVSQLLLQSHGSGIVVSLYECLERYGHIKRILSCGSLNLPSDPREIREWALVMAVTGVLNAIDRQLIPNEGEVLIHASGSYSEADYEVYPSHLALEASRGADLMGGIFSQR